MLIARDSRRNFTTFLDIRNTSQRIQIDFRNSYRISCSIGKLEIKNVYMLRVW